MNAIDKFRIAPQFYSLQDIKLYYDNSLRSIECAYSASENLNYTTRFLGKSEKEVREEVLWVKKELSHLCSMCVMAYLESLFRIDSFVRVKHKCKGNITAEIKKLLKGKSSIPLVRFEDILDVWKAENMDKAELFREIKSHFMFRHWIAHGRYWKLDDNIDTHFDFIDVFMLAQQVESQLGTEIRTQDKIEKAKRLI